MIIYSTYPHYSEELAVLKFLNLLLVVVVAYNCHRNSSSPRGVADLPQCNIRSGTTFAWWYFNWAYIL